MQGRNLWPFGWIPVEPTVIIDEWRRILAVIGVTWIWLGVCLVGAGAQPDILGGAWWAILFFLAGGLALIYARHPTSWPLYNAASIALIFAPLGRALGLLVGSAMNGTAQGWWRVAYTVTLTLIAVVLLRLAERRMVPDVQAHRDPRP